MLLVDRVKPLAAHGPTPIGRPEALDVRDKLAIAAASASPFGELAAREKHVVDTLLGPCPDELAARPRPALHKRSKGGRPAGTGSTMLTAGALQARLNPRSAPIAAGRPPTVDEPLTARENTPACRPRLPLPHGVQVFEGTLGSLLWLAKERETSELRSDPDGLVRPIPPAAQAAAKAAAALNSVEELARRDKETGPETAAGALAVREKLSSRNAAP